MRSKILAFFAAAFIALFLTAQIVHACSCPPPPSLAEAVAGADAVFLGRVLSFELAPAPTERVAQFEIIKVWKGRPIEVSRVFTPENEAACGVDFRVGETYIVYAAKEESGALHTHLCSRTWFAAGAQEDLDYLAGFATFPLAPGNSWHYESNFGTKLTEAIRDTVRVEGRLYYRFDQFREFENALLRLSDDGKLFLLSDQPEQMWIDFNAAEKETWHVVGPLGLAEWDVQLVSKTDTIRTPSGTYFPCLRFHFKFNGADNDWVEWYHPNVGVVKRDLLGIAVFEYPLANVILNKSTGVNDHPLEHAPRAFALAQNYPNPVAHTSPAQSVTRIRFALQEPAEVSLTIFNALGQQVRALANGYKAAGEYHVLWNGKDEAERSVPAGVYFYRLQVGRFAELKKMVVLQ